MTEDEFMASVQWAVENDQGSGLKDIFGACERIIRPQEMMFTHPRHVYTKRQELRQFVYIIAAFLLMPFVPLFHSLRWNRLLILSHTLTRVGALLSFQLILMQM